MGVRAMLIAPTAMYPVACLLMAAQGWWAGNLEAVFAAPITALRLALLAYPLTVILLWVVYRRWRPRSALLRKVAVLTLALAAYFALIRPLGLFRFPAGFMAGVVGLTTLACASWYGRMEKAQPCATS